MSSTVKNLLRSRFAAALAGAALVNLWLGYGHPFRKVPTANLDKGEVLQAVASYRKEVKEAPVVFLGSSLVIAPVMQAEANLLGQPIERMTHRRIRAIEQELSRSDQAGLQAYCLASGGAMVSDMYLIAKNVLCGKAKPRAIIYGIAPRDFQDNLLPGVESTEAFRGLATLSDLSDTLNSSELTFETKADLALGRICPLWLYRSDARTYIGLRTKKLMEATMPWVVFDKYGETLELKPRRRGMFPEEVQGTPHIFPGLALDHISRERTRDEYARRYLPIAPKLVDREFAYLDKLIGVCKDRQIPLLLVNMPLSLDNLSILPDGYYERYRNRLRAVCQQHDVAFVDLCRPELQQNSLFVDGVHIDSAASQSFVRTLCASAKQAIVPGKHQSFVAATGAEKSQ